MIKKKETAFGMTLTESVSVKVGAWVCLCQRSICTSQFVLLHLTDVDMILFTSISTSAAFSPVETPGDCWGGTDILGCVFRRSCQRQRFVGYFFYAE